MISQDDCTEYHNDPASGDDVEGRKRQQNPDWRHAKDPDKQGGQGWSRGRGGGSPLGGQEISHLEQGLKQDVASGGELSQRLHDLVQALVMPDGGIRNLPFMTMLLTGQARRRQGREAPGVHAQYQADDDENRTCP